MKRNLFLIALLISGTILFGQSQRLVLIEEFTQASCPPCAERNPAFNKLLFANPTKVSFIKYQTSWPGKDPMNAQNKAEIAVRASYTHADKVGVPFAINDGLSVKGGTFPEGDPEGLTQAKINAEYAVPSSFDMKLQYLFNAAKDSIFITCKITCTKEITLTTPKLHVAMIEKNITFATAPGTNGEKVFEHVMRKMYPNADGTALVTQWVLGKTETFTFKAAIPTYIYKKEEIAMIAWIQDDQDQNVKQSAYSPITDPSTGIQEESATVRLNTYPNPSSSLVNISFESVNFTNYALKITNAIGQVVYEESLLNFKGLYSRELDLLKYGKGIYIVSIGNSSTEQVQKVVIY
jgi:hypothetical protein